MTYSPSVAVITSDEQALIVASDLAEDFQRDSNLRDRERRLPLPELRRQVGMVFQENFLFSNTIAANIAFGHPEATQERIERAAEAGNAEARDLVTYFVGQGVGLVEEIRPSRAVVQSFREEYVEAVERLAASLG